MFDEPSRAALLAVTEESLKTDVLPALDGAAKYAALMVLNAIGIARREVAAGYEPPRHVLDAYADLYGQDNVYHAGFDAAERIPNLNRHLAREIRDGEHDDELGEPGPVYDVLRALVIERLKLSNPRFLVESEYSQPSRG
ncbi:MAG: hypothetical protein HQ481_11820 [Alphaproteobacteria bacterium]|nr:hypothetical protein [Alphaproteobacteria bacterium]